MREKFMKFMYGRYGVDRLSKHLVAGAILCSLLSTLFNSEFLLLLSLGMIIYGYFRIFSKNHAKRYAEGRAYENFLNRLKKFPNQLKKETAMRKDYRIFRCPTCRQKIRIPKGRGEVEIRCQKCKTVFRKRT